MAQFNLSITLEYDLASASHKLQLVEEVRKWIADNWQPLGGAFAHEGEIYQTMVREKPKTAAHEFEIARAMAMGGLPNQRETRKPFEEAIPPAGSLDIVTGSGSIENLPYFLANSLRVIVSRLRQAGMWQGDYDILLTTPKNCLADFFRCWSKYRLGTKSETETKGLIERKLIFIDGVRIRVAEGLSDRYYLSVIKTEGNELIEWDSEFDRWLFRAPWAIAGYEVA